MTELIIDLVRHMKAKDRGKWSGDDDLRPLSKLGLRQALQHAEAMAAGNPIVAIYTSPALRCRQTIEPLAELTGLAAEVEPLLAETAIFRPDAENSLLVKLSQQHPEGGRIVLCSHGNTIPDFIQSLNASTDCSAPEVIFGFGGWYRVHIDDAGISVRSFYPPEGFPRKKT